MVFSVTRKILGSSLISICWSQYGSGSPHVITRSAISACAKSVLSPGCASTVRLAACSRMKGRKRMN